MRNKILTKILNSHLHLGYVIYMRCSIYMTKPLKIGQVIYKSRLKFFGFLKNSWERISSHSHYKRATLYSDFGKVFPNNLIVDFDDLVERASC